MTVRATTRDPTARFRAARSAVIAAADLSAAQRRRALSDLADSWLSGLLSAAGAAGAPVALVAVGGYGRRELLPGSDLDIVLVHDLGDGVAAIADAVFYPVWDARIALDHSVRTTAEARSVAATDLKAALGMLDARHIAGERALTEELRGAVLADWRSAGLRRLPDLAAMCRDRQRRNGDLPYLLEPDLVDAYGGLRDTVALRAVAATWLADRPHAPIIDEAREWLLTVRDGLHRGPSPGSTERRRRRGDRLVLQEQDAVAARLGLLDADALLRRVSEAGRVIAYASDVTWREVERTVRGRSKVRGGLRRLAPARTGRTPLADGVVEQDGEAVLALDSHPATDAVLPLRAAAAAAQRGLVLSPHTVDRLAAECPPLSVPWPAAARDALVTLLGAGRPAVPVWEALDTAGIIAGWIPDWERVRFRPQRNAVHRHTVDRHLVETAVEAASLTRTVARPDLLLLSALLHDLGKGWPGDHSETGAVIARSLATRFGLPPEDVDTVELLVRRHLLLPETATRRDLDDPVTVQGVADVLQNAAVLDLLAALTEADAIAAGPLAWTPWRAGLVRDLVGRVRVVLGGDSPPSPPRLDPWHLTLAALGDLAVLIDAPDPDGVCRVSVVCPDRVGLLATVSAVLELNNLDVRSATIETVDAVSVGNGSTRPATAVQVWRATSAFGPPPDERRLREELRHALDGTVDVASRLEARKRSVRPTGIPVAPPSVRVVPAASQTATVVEIRAHDRPGLLREIATAVSGAGVLVRSAVIGTLGAEAVDTLYLVDPAGRPLDPGLVDAVLAEVRAVLD